MGYFETVWHAQSEVLADGMVVCWWDSTKQSAFYSPLLYCIRDLKLCATRNPPSLLTHYTHSSFDS